MAIYHIVLVKFKPTATQAQKVAWKTAITSLKSSIPQIKELVSGPKIPHKIDGGWEDGVIMKFDNEEDLSDYVVAPAHQAYLAETTEQTLADIRP
ncbi:hypothetical protein SCHPADRAFT_430213 [Schizopora paradoxa]|uniref:Stress-response A/B barrel domain-containing protein n=1 Tax=Schizopora paradoxa TaxID=27342 RepID=A0A0H2RRW0_9AGAM|nr:hypothetical protein SCHPADRAFT_430213 [Schizopora paradoxa]